MLENLEGCSSLSGQSEGSDLGVSGGSNCHMVPDEAESLARPGLACYLDGIRTGLAAWPSQSCSEREDPYQSVRKH